jgi:hypothetical protein
MTDPIDDEAFLIAFRDATLPPAAFTHEAHLRLASSEARMYYLEPDLIPFDGDRTIPPVRSQPREHETD